VLSNTFQISSNKSLNQNAIKLVDYKLEITPVRFAQSFALLRRLQNVEAIATLLQIGNHFCFLGRSDRHAPDKRAIALSPQ